MKKLFQILILTSSLCGNLFAQTEQLAPDQLVKKVAEEVIDAIKQDKDLQAGDREKALALAEEKVLPLIDFKRATQLAMGKHWRDATPVQKESLVREFRAMLIRTYSSAIGVYRGQTLEVKPLRAKPDDMDVVVNTEYLKPGAPTIPVDYRMRKNLEGWRAYDVIVDGVSLVTTYRGSFTAEIRQVGIDGLIQTLMGKNHKPALVESQQIKN